MWRPWRQWQQGNMSKFCLVASRFWAFSKSPSVFSKRVICPGEVTPSHKWNCQSHGWQAFSVWENTSCLQGKSWCLAGQQRQVAKGSTSLEMLWSVNTPKTHMMGHISLSIKALRLTVGYTTEMGELQHKYSKSAYANSNKGPDKDFQIARRAFQRHKIDAIRQANKLSRRSGHDLQRPTEKMHLLNSDRKTRMRAPRGYSIQKLLWDMGDDSSCTQFSLRLKRHLWSRLSSPQDRDPARTPIEVHCQITMTLLKLATILLWISMRISWCRCAQGPLVNTHCLISDFRALNNQTIPNMYPMGNVQDNPTLCWSKGQALREVGL